MAFKKGQSGNPEGRPAGTPNRTTEELRGMVLSFINLNWQDLQDKYKTLDAREQLNFIERLLRHVLPAQKAIDLTADLSGLNDQQLDYIINSLISKENEDR